MLGLLLVGIGGCTASTVVTGLLGGEPAPGWGSIATGLGLDHHLVPLDEIAVGGWDFARTDLLGAVRGDEILPAAVIDAAAGPLREVKVRPAVVGPYDVEEARTASHTVRPRSMRSAATCVADDIERFRAELGAERVVVVYLGAPLRSAELSVDADLEHLLDRQEVHSGIAYALGALSAGAGFVDFTPNVTLEMKAVSDLAIEAQLPLAGRDGSTGQTLVKAVLAEMFRWRNLKVDGWYSTNLIGNNDGRVLSRPEHQQTKLEDKRQGLPRILGYDDVEHIVDIRYYGPRGDRKEAWDCIDYRGWLDGEMTVRIDSHGRDSILAAPLVLDLARHLDHSLRGGQAGMQTHLGIYFKRPLGVDDLRPSVLLEDLTGYYTNEEN